MRVQNELIISFTTALKDIFEFYKSRSRLTPEEQMVRISDLNSKYSVEIPNINLFLVENNFLELFGNTQNQTLSRLFNATQYWPIKQDLPALNDLLTLIDEFFKRLSDLIKVELPKFNDLLPFLRLPPNPPPAAAARPTASPALKKLLNNERTFFSVDPTQTKKRTKITTIDTEKLVVGVWRVYDFYVKHKNNKKEYTSKEIFRKNNLHECTDVKDDLARSKFVGFIKKFLRKHEFIKFDDKNAGLIEVTEKPFCSSDQLEKLLESFQQETKENRRERDKKRAASKLEQSRNKR